MIHKLREDFVYIYISIWLHLSSIIFIVNAGLSLVAQQLLIFLSLPLFFILMLKKETQYHGINKFQFILFLLTMFVLLFGIFDTSSFNILGRAMNFFYLCIFTFFLNMKTKDFIPKLLYYYTIFGIVTLFVCFYTVYGIESRHELEVHPNFIGMIVLSIILSSLFVKSKMFTLVLYVVSFFILMIVSSRASILCVLIVMFFEFFIFKKVLFFNSKNKYIKFLLIVSYGFITLYFGFEVINSLFLLDDEYRGIATGLSGRDTRWALGIEKWFENFWFGIGYGESIADTGISMDNAYVTILLEIGLIGLLLYLTLNIYALYTYFKNKEYYLVLFIFVYLLYGIFEKRYFSVGNSFSILYIFVLFSITNKRTKKGTL